jgi:hypothetical protein
MDLLYMLLAGAALAALVRWWQPRLSLAAAGGHLVLAAAFYAAALATPLLQVPTDIAYGYRPWLETRPGPVVAKNAVLFDVVSQMVPFRALVRTRLFAGEAPLWAHEVGAGQPLLGNAQSAPFAPLHLVAIGLPPLRALTLAAALQTLLALLLMHALVRALGAGEAGAALAAVAYALSSYLVAWSYYPIGMAACWVPGVLLGLVALSRGERGALAGLVACGLGIALSGHPETLTHTAIASAVALAALLARPGGISRGRFLGRVALATLVTALLAAPVLLPFLEVVPESERWAAIARNGGRFPVPEWRPRQLQALVDPLAFGSPRDGNWQGTSNFNELCTTWAGLVPLALATAAALAGRRWWLLAAAALAAGAAFGAPPLVALFQAIPGLAEIPLGRLRLLAVLAVAIAAGLAVEELREGRGRRVLAAATLVAAGVGLALVPPPLHAWQRAWWIASLAGAATCAGVLVVPRWRRFLPWVAVAATVADLVLLGVRYNPLLPATLDLEMPAALRPILAERQRGPFRTLGIAGDLLPNLGALYGLWDPRAYDPVHPDASREVIAAAWRTRPSLVLLLDSTGIAVGARDRDAPARPMLDFLGVRYLVAPPVVRLPRPWKRAWRAEGGRVWTNPAALPLLFMPSRVDPVHDSKAAFRRTVDNRDFAAAAVVESASGAPEQHGAVRILRTTANGFALDVDSPSGGIVVSSVSFVRGWQVEVGGAPAKPLRVNAGFVGFRVAPGRHRATLDYRPSGWTWGLRMAGAGLLLAALLAWRSLRTARAAPASVAGA